MKANNVCRTCGSSSAKSRFSLFETLQDTIGNKTDHIKTLAEFLSTIIPQMHPISENDGLPATICAECFSVVKQFQIFQEKCLESDRFFRNQTNQLITMNLEELPQNEGLAQFNDTTMTPLATEVEQSGISAKNLECSFCHKVLKSRKTLKVHLQLHSEVDAYLCNSCGERFKTKMAYTGHMATHDKSGFRCELCGKSYRQAASLRNHELNHSQHKPFGCAICGHKTTQKSGLKKHMLVHSDHKPFTCDVCGKDFRFVNNLAMHRKRNHEREKLFGCDVCDKKFVTNDELKNHSMCHTDERPFGCADCGKQFNRRSSLLSHRKSKHSVKEKRFGCRVCGREFSKNDTLQNHLRTHIVAD
ncbi:oocyte zinc finger protein XlCOF26-like [Uranotaenia lowii]|uniref:oocyte zinc finger protein XlCOF26-like n=1 Tax=Uranotaenia lowii TaxID=190385 RepID=UPI00247993B2|nr:oocyte zinc finger protein XlCOF26-like [Uranotaenia lowii]